MFSLSTQSLSRLLSLLNPAPDDLGPWVPATPVVPYWEWLELNPRPLPPKAKDRQGLGPSPDPWGQPGPVPWRWGPQPDPWRFGITVRAAIARILDRFEQAGIIVVGGAQEHQDAARQQIGYLVDELCGTPPRRKPFPGPWGPVLDSDELDPRVLFVAGAQFARTATGLSDDHALAGPLFEAADQVFAVAAAKMEG